MAARCGLRTQCALGTGICCDGCVRVNRCADVCHNSTAACGQLMPPKPKKEKRIYADRPLDGEGLRERRMASGLGRAGVARKIGVSISSIQHWEEKHYEPTLKNILALVNLFGGDLDDYLIKTARQDGNPDTGQHEKV